MEKAIAKTYNYMVKSYMLYDGNSVVKTFKTRRIWLKPYYRIMKTKTVSANNCKHINILQFGTEENSKKAQWGPGARELYIIHYVLKGKGYFNGKEVKRGQGFLIRANERVQYFSDKNEPWQYFWITFTGTAANEICQEYLSSNDDNIFDYKDYTELYELMEKIFASKLTQAKALSFFYDILSLGVKEESVVGNQYVIASKEYIRVHLCQPFQVMDIAKSLGISDRYLYNLFIKYEGQSPKEYINDVKIKYAEKLLKNSHSSISEIATSVGYYDVLAFSRFFSKKKGVSPSEYRKSYVNGL